MLSSFSNLLRSPLSPMGVEFSDHSLRGIAFRRNGRSLDLSFHDRHSLPTGTVEGGVIKDAPAFLKSLAALYSSAEKVLGSVPAVVTALPEEQTFLQVLSVPAIWDKAKLAEVVRWETAGTIPESIEDVVLDFSVLEVPIKGKSHRDVLVGTAPLEYIRSVQSAFEESGFHLAAFDLESLALLRALFGSRSVDKPVLIADIGASRTTFIVVVGGAVLLTSTVEVGVTLMEAALQKELGVDEDEAAQHLITVGIAGKKKNKKGKTKKRRKITEDDILDALLPILTDLNQQIREYLSFYRTHAEHAHTSVRSIAGVVLSGSGASIQGLPEYLALQLRLPVRHGNPWAGAQFQGLSAVPDLPLADSLAFSTAIGLALHSL